MESIKELAQAQQQMVLDRAEDWIHELQLEEQRQLTQGNERSCERAFCRRAELMDLARKYCKLNAELNLRMSTADNFLNSIWRKVVLHIENEIRQLEF